MSSLSQRITEALALPPRGVTAVLDLIEGGATVPFIARYRKEATGGLDEVQIRAIAERADYLRDLDARKLTVLAAIEEQGKLTPSLRARIDACRSKTELEDLYLPFKRSRRTKAMIAREQGLEPLARRILEQPSRGNLRDEAARFVDAAKEVPNIEAALAGAREIVTETVSEEASVRAYQRETFARQGVLRAKVIGAKKKERTKFEDYYDFADRLERLPSHRYLAICRGEAEGVLRAKVEVDDRRVKQRIAQLMCHDVRSPFGAELEQAIDVAYSKRLTPSITKQVRADAAVMAERQAIQVFAENLENLLLAAPFGERAVVAIDPGIRTGCKCVALSATGRFLANITIYPLRSEGEKARAEAELVSFVRKHAPAAVAVGDGTGGRETESFTRDALKRAHIDASVVSVSEAGASIYSASDIAREEHPDLDLTVRGAISIGRRLQDPLAELVKLDPKSIGVGQYQHDVDQSALGKKLGEVVESCVNRVGVDLNTASAPLLSHVAGIGPKLAQNIVAHRDSKGRFDGRRALLRVKGLGPKAFEQAAGFLRVRDAKSPLDASGVHPERYALVERMAKDLRLKVADLVGDSSKARAIDLQRYVGDGVGEPTLRDIVAELEKPGRDPRERFEITSFRDDVREFEDLKEGMQLQGLVTNVTAFGAFVNIGVHQDGLLHISQLADHFVRDPTTEVKVGQRVIVRVLSVDLARRRISLSRKGVAGN